MASVKGDPTTYRTQGELQLLMDRGHTFIITHAVMPLRYSTINSQRADSYVHIASSSNSLP